MTFLRFERLISASNKVRSAAAVDSRSSHSRDRDVGPPVNLFNKRPHPVDLWPLGPAHVVRHPHYNLLDPIFRGKLQNTLNVLFRCPTDQGFNALSGQPKFVAKCNPNSFRSDVQAKDTQANPPYVESDDLIDSPSGGTGVINYCVTVKAPVLV